MDEKRTYFVKSVELPAAPPSGARQDASAKQDTILVDYYEIKGAVKTPVIIVLPILGGNNNESKLFCAYFAKHGIASLLVHRDQKQKEAANPQNLESSLKDMIRDHRVVIDWIATQEKLDSEKIGVFGASMGGIKAALLTALDSRIKASVIALAGGDLPYILLHSKEKGVVRKITQLMRERTLNEKDMYAWLKTTIETDPILFAKYIDARKVLLVRTIFDKIVPTVKQRELWSAIGRPERIDILAGHYTSVAYIFYVQRASLSFFRKKFANM